MSTPNIPLTLNRDALPISASVNDILTKYTSTLSEIQRLLAEVEWLRSDRDCEKRIRKEAEARADKSECAETVAIAHWNGALERAMKAEADLAALAQCHDDNCRAVVSIAAELVRECEKAERYRLASLKLDAALAAERARLDAGTIMLTVAGERVWHSGVNLRAAIDAAIKEGAK